MVYARKFIDGGVRPWANYSIYSGLSETRSPEERREIVDEYFENVINEVSKTTISICDELHSCTRTF